MKKQSGFIQIPILLTILVGIMLLGGTGYFVVYKKIVSKNLQTDQANISNPSTSESSDNNSQDAGIVNNTDITENTVISPTSTIKKTLPVVVDVCANIEGV